MAIVEELHARRVLDLGAGTGVFACRLAATGKDVVAVEPAQASVNVARRRPEAARVRWIVGDAAAMPAEEADVVTMTANVPEQMSDEEWADALAAAYRALRPGGHLVFGNRDPARQPWLTTSWSSSERVEDTPEGPVRHELAVVDVAVPQFTFRWMFVFERDGEAMVWEATFRLRTSDEIQASLAAAGFVVTGVRDDDDAHIFIAARR